MKVFRWIIGALLISTMVVPPLLYGLGFLVGGVGLAYLALFWFVVSLIILLLSFIIYALLSRKKERRLSVQKNDQIKGFSFSRVVGISIISLLILTAFLILIFNPTYPAWGVLSIYGGVFLLLGLILIFI